MYDMDKIPDSTIAKAPHNVVSQWCLVQTACCDRIPCCWERASGKHPQMSLQCSLKVVRLTEALLVAGWKEWWVLKQEKLCSGYCVTVVLPELLQCVDAIVCEDWHITHWQLVLSLSFSKGNVVTSLEMLDFWWCAWDVLLGAWQLNTKPIEKPFIRSFWHILKLSERPSYPRLLQQLKPGSIILNPRQSQSIEWHHSPWQKKFVSGQGHD